MLGQTHYKRNKNISLFIKLLRDIGIYIAHK